MELEADNYAVIIRENAEARLKTAQFKSQALIKEASAEEKMAEKLEGMRRHEEKMKLATALKKLSTKGNMVLSGKSG